jgi:predicted nuclease with TOPRIM domain
LDIVATIPPTCFRASQFEVCLALVALGSTATYSWQQRQKHMQTANIPTTPRRSSRVPTAVPILVTSLNGKHFSEVCETLVVNAHGCAMLSPIKLDAGVPLHFHSKDGREATAHVVSCQPVGADNRTWRLGTRLDRPENFWGLTEYPQDWPTSTQLAASIAGSGFHAELNQPPKAVVDRIVRQLEAQVKRTISDSVRPLQEELTGIKEKLARREGSSSRFEVSLSSIPPELEQQLGSRLENNLGPRVLEEARQQAAHLLAAANAAITQRTSEGYENFVRRVAEELKLVEKRARDTSTYISESVQQELRRGVQDYQEKLLEGGNSLKRLSEELIQYLKDNLNEEHNARRGDLQQLRSSLESESTRLNEQIESLNGRIAELHQSARSLESGLDQRLSQMASNTLKDARTELEAVANGIREELTAKTVKVLAAQLDEASANMKVVQKGIIASVSESLRTQASDTLQVFERAADEVAKLSVEHCRHDLTRALNAAIKSIGEELQSPEEVN